jgi:raffinose/stachyose/melibiose transport system substrate-binding protein
VELSFWSWRQEDKAAYQSFIDLFNRDHPDIEVTFQAFEAQNYPTILSTALAGEQGPDVMMVRAYGAFQAVAEPGYLAPLDETTVPELKAFPADAVAAETLKADGKIYAVPFAQQSMLVLYNQAVFDAAGLEEPETWDDLVAVSQALQEQGVIPFANGTATAWQNETIVGALLSSLIGKQFEADVMAGKATFEDPHFVSALARLDALKTYFPPGFVGVDYATAQQLFLSGRAAMFAGGSYEIGNFQRQNPDLEIGIFASPVERQGDERLVALFYDGGYAINAGTEHPEAALAFVRWLASREFGNAFANTLGNISPIEGVTFGDPLLAEVAELNRHAMSYIMLVHFRYQEPSGSVLLQQNVQKMLAGEATPEEVGRAITDGIATYYEPFAGR